jgi:hypothetical protein
MKAYGGVDLYIYILLTSALVGGSGQLHVPAAYPQGKRPWYPLDRRSGGPQSQSEGHGGENS